MDVVFFFALGREDVAVGGRGGPVEGGVAALPRRSWGDGVGEGRRGSVSGVGKAAAAAEREASRHFPSEDPSGGSKGEGGVVREEEGEGIAVA